MNGGLRHLRHRLPVSTAPPPIARSRFARPVSPRSRPPGDTPFRVRSPISKPRHHAHRAPPPDPVALPPSTLADVPGAPVNADALAGRRVLLIEDEASTREVLARVLESAGAAVAVAATGQAGIDAYVASSPDLVLSDVGLPDIDGYTVLDRIRAVEREAGRGAVPAVALTAYAGEEDRKRAADAGFTAHVAKPVDAGHLIATLARVIAPG